MTLESKYPMFDAADYVHDADDAAFLLEATLEDSAEDPSALPAALDILACAGNMSEPARRVGMSQDGL